MPDLDFEFYAGGIEDGILDALQGPMDAIGVKDFATYSGQLDDEKSLKAAISSQVLKFPAVLVSYAGGEDFPDPETSAVLGRSLHFRHDCSFSIIVLDNHPQGEGKRRRGKVYSMISVVRKTLTGVRLKKEVSGQHILLNSEPFVPVENIRIMLPEITAFGVVTNTAFKWSSPDRTAAGTPVTDIIVGASSRNDPHTNPGNTPGVTFSTGENDV